MTEQEERLRAQLERVHNHFLDDALVQSALREARGKLALIVAGHMPHPARRPYNWDSLLSYGTKFALGKAPHSRKALSWVYCE